MCRVPWVQVCSIFPESPQIFFVMSRNSPIKCKILQSNLQYLNSPLEILCADFRALGHVCREKCKILQSNVKFSSRISNMEILPSNSNSPLASRPRNSPCECEKRFVKEQTYIKRPYPLFITPLYGLWSLGCHVRSRGITRVHAIL